MKEILNKYQLQAPSDGGALMFVGDLDSISGDLVDKDVEEEGEEDEKTTLRRKDLARRMEGLDIEQADFEEIWARLDAHEREEFVRLAQELEQEEPDLLLQD